MKESFSFWISEVFLGFFLLSTGFRSAFSREQRQKLKSTKNDEEAARPMMNRWRAVTARPPARPPGRHYRAAPSVIKSRHPIGRRRHSRRHVTPPSSDALLLFLFFSFLFIIRFRFSRFGPALGWSRNRIFGFFFRYRVSLFYRLGFLWTVLH